MPSKSKAKTSSAPTTASATNKATPAPVTKKSGIGIRDGVISELSTFYEVIPGHEEELRAACERLANTLKNAPLELNIETGLRDERHVIFDGGKRLAWFTTFESDWDPYVEDAILRIGIENFIDWVQHTKQWDRFEAWIQEAGGVARLNQAQTDANVRNEVRATTLGLKKFLQENQYPAAAYYNAVSYITHPQIRKALAVYQAFQQVLDTDGAAEALQNPALKPLLDLASD